MIQLSIRFSGIDGLEELLESIRPRTISLISNMQSQCLLVRRRRDGKRMPLQIRYDWSLDKDILSLGMIPDGSRLFQFQRKDARILIVHVQHRHHTDSLS